MRRAILVILLTIAGVRLIAQLPPVSPQVQGFWPIRIIGTNLYDFSAVIQDALNRGSNAYLVRGEVARSGVSGLPRAVILTRLTGRAYYQFVGSPLAKYGGGYQLQSAAAAQIAAQNNGRITLGAYLAMDPTMRLNYQLVREVEYVVVANVPTSLSPGQSVTLFALPVGRYDENTGCVGPVGVPYYNYGIAFKGRLSDYRILYRVTPLGVSGVPILPAH